MTSNYFLGFPCVVAPSSDIATSKLFLRRLGGALLVVGQFLDLT
jgi:hypothetical protein